MEYIEHCITSLSHKIENNPQLVANTVLSVRIGKNDIVDEDEPSKTTGRQCVVADSLGHHLRNQEQLKTAWLAQHLMKVRNGDNTPDNQSVFDNNVREKYFNSVRDMIRARCSMWNADYLVLEESATKWNGRANDVKATCYMDVTPFLLTKTNNKLTQTPTPSTMRIEEYIHHDKEHPNYCNILWYAYDLATSNMATFFQSSQTPAAHGHFSNRVVNECVVYDYQKYLQIYQREEGMLENPYSQNVVKKLSDLELQFVIDGYMSGQLMSHDVERHCRTETTVFRRRLVQYYWIVGTCWFVVMSSCQHRVPTPNQTVNYGFATWEIELCHVSVGYHLHNINHPIYANLSRFLNEYFEATQRQPVMDLRHEALKSVMWWKYNKQSTVKYATGQNSALAVKKLSGATFDTYLKQPGAYEQLKQRCHYMFSNLPYDISRNRFQEICAVNADLLKPSSHKKLITCKPDGVVVAAILYAGQDIFLMTRSFELMRVNNSRAQCQRIRMLLDMCYPLAENASSRRSGAGGERVYLIEGELVETRFQEASELYHLAHYSHLPALVVFSVSYFLNRLDDKTYFLRYCAVPEAVVAELLKQGHDDVGGIDNMDYLVDEELLTNDNRLYNMCGCGATHKDGVFCLRSVLQGNAAAKVNVISNLKIVQQTPLLMFHKPLFTRLGKLQADYGFSVERMTAAFGVFESSRPFEVAIDGVIISPRLTEFCRQVATSEIYEPINEEKRALYKWKPLDRRTMDFECFVSPCGKYLQLYVMDSDYVVVSAQREPMFNMDRKRRLNMHRVPLERVSFRKDFADRHAISKTVGEYFAENRAVHEFSYSVKDERWWVVNCRRDKTTPNNVVVVTYILMHIIDGLTFGEMLAIEQDEDQKHAEYKNVDFDNVGSNNNMEIKT